jgi:threonine aldolase
MQTSRGHQFASDNTAGVCPEVLDAMAQANFGAADAYGGDEWTTRLRDRVCELFETDCALFMAFNGTAANALALAQLSPSFGSIVCHESAHIQTDECGAPEFFSGGAKLLLARGDSGKIDIDHAREIVARQPELHAPRPRAVSVTQATEFGTVYTRNDIAALSEFARSRDMRVHMDGARFANAIAHLSWAPKEITWQAGVDVLCFGGTKNGLASGELVVFFKRELAREFDYRLKQAGQVGSKTRFAAAAWLALLRDDLWLRNARNANECAQRLARRLRDEAKIDILFPAEANAVFVRLPDELVRHLHDIGWFFYKFIEPDVYRLMCAWSVTPEDVDLFMADLQRAHS